MAEYQLKSAAEIALVNASPDFAGIASARKAQLQVQLAVVANELATVLPTLLGQITVEVERTYVRALFIYSDGGTSTPPAGGAVAPGYSGQITSVGDGAAGSLERVASANLADYAWREFYRPAADEVQGWLLYPDAEAPANGEKQQPLDHDAATNARTWARKR